MIFEIGVLQQQEAEELGNPLLMMEFLPYILHVVNSYSSAMRELNSH